MDTHSVAEAKNQLSRLIDLALDGQTVVITRHGTPVVELRPVTPAPRAVSEAAIDWLDSNLVECTATEDAGTLVSRMRDEWAR